MAWQFQLNGQPLTQAQQAQLTPQQLSQGFMTDSGTGEILTYDAYKQRNDQQTQLQLLQAQMDQTRQMAAQGLNSDGTPIRPEYESLLDPETGLLKSQYILKDVDKSTLEGYNAIKQRALGTQPSAWAQLTLDKAKQDAMQQKDSAARQAMSGQNQAFTDLAARGGLSSGARERVTRSGARDLMSARQGVESQANTNRFNILTEDEKQRMALLPQFADAEGKLAMNSQNTQKMNIMGALDEKRAKDSQALQVYQEQMKKWASEREAQATESQGGGGK